MGLPAGGTSEQRSQAQGLASRRNQSNAGRQSSLGGSPVPSKSGKRPSSQLDRKESVTGKSLE